MHPYLPFAAIPLAGLAAWFAASHWSGSDPGRYHVPAVTQIENPSVPVAASTDQTGKADIRVAAFLPGVPPKPPAPTPDLILHSVMTGTDVHVASINGRVVRVGDTIQGYRVQSIAADGVELSAGGATRRLPMRSLHELPPPVHPGTDPLAQHAAARPDQDDLNREFWATFESP